MSTYRSFVLRGAVGALRTATFRKRDHLIVPVTALVEGVLHPFNAARPELVLSEEFSRAPSGWNGEPVMLDHPEVDGIKVSANSPGVLESWQLGQVFNTRVSGDRLLMDAYIDLARVEEVGEQAQDLIKSLQDGGTIEVSVGALISLEPAQGVHNGVAYFGIWRDIVPDHLALLPTGLIGACSVEKGCGAGISRAASVHLITAQGIAPLTPIMEEVPMTVKPRTLRERFKALISGLTPAELRDNEGLSDNDARRMLDQKLFSIEPAFGGVYDVFSEEKQVIYGVSPEGQHQLVRRSFSISDDGDVTLGDDREIVEPVTEYKPVAAEQHETAQPRAAGCGCHKNNVSADDGAPAEKENNAMHKNAERITALIANPKTGWKEADRAFLETATDTALATLEAAAVEPEPVKPEVKLEDLPAEWQKAINGAAEAELAERNSTIETLAAAQQTFSKDELAKMPTEQLTKLASLVGKPAEKKVVNFGAAAGVKVASQSGVPAPPDLNARFAKKA